MPGARQLIVAEIKSASDARLAGAAGSRLLLSLLYSFLQQYQLRDALYVTEFLVRQSDVSKAVAMSQQDEATKVSLLTLLQQVREVANDLRRRYNINIFKFCVTVQFLAV